VELIYLAGKHIAPKQWHTHASGIRRRQVQRGRPRAAGRDRLVD